MDSQISPKTTEEDHERATDCASAMEIAFARLVAEASAAGWREMEVAVILADIADDHVLRLAKKSRRGKFN
ncbi:MULTISPECIES: hypothetical protein [unclassified Rhizobium]|uniref:hypothetical protein n=1 Tax=unclassified Rhizobium TaxID=2613769 RepID=UPI001AD9EE47|nr:MULTISPECIES: hypothetical protein [unclassified Rhizobium]MBO9098669.1 hypothetical protein [Rhizobium sp. L58/93]MBO9132526.1 hypothetical protein [Rhizobium sp. B209b/85]MBO9168935.1 hypothetical protein [Rhizobium sp. L245/93]MBO9184885.1 hypothetical protein [Rhizobium sp. E27B/91]QXZ85052.1 hypothetical protein J5287_05825 [Rhizobium sp. K1/93]